MSKKAEGKDYNHSLTASAPTRLAIGNGTQERHIGATYRRGVICYLQNTLHIILSEAWRHCGIGTAAIASVASATLTPPGTGVVSRER